MQHFGYKFLHYYKASFFVLGAVLALAFAPIFGWPALSVLAIFALYVQRAGSIRVAAIYGFWFGFGFFTASLYWLAIGVSVYIEDFWWALPFALFGISCILGFFISGVASLGWCFRSSSNYSLYFSVAWVAMEWVRSWIFTGFPWNLLGYSLAFSDELIQLASIFGPYGLSFFVIYLVVGLTSHTSRNAYAAFAFIAIISTIAFGTWRLSQNPTIFTDVRVRIVQPSIPQSDKWNEEDFWQNLQKHIELSRINTGFEPDLLLWSEAAVTAPYKIRPIKRALQDAIVMPHTTLITGGVTDNDKIGRDYALYSGMYAMNKPGNILFEYHKSHLVPFGEYMPLKSWLPVKKLTHGLIDYTPGVAGQVFLLNGLRIRPLVCYEVIFPSEVRNTNFDVMINVTNDAWYGNSSGPYQHLQTARMRAVENGAPLLRAANNGISAVIDPMGRILSETTLWAVTTIDSMIPLRLQNHTTYSIFGEWMCILAIVIMVLIRRITETIATTIQFSLKY
jgi:apolipoprotein N-acyltransferase